MTTEVKRWGDYRLEPVYGNGCVSYNDCFTCPYPIEYCGKDSQIEKYKLALKVYEMWQQGTDLAQIARDFKLDVKTITRYIKLAMEQGGR